VTDPLDRVRLSARYDRSNRIIEAGDAANSSIYEYSSISGEISRRTVVTDPMGAKTTYEHNENGALIAVSDDEGHTRSIAYNAANRRTRLANSFGDETIFSYDLQNRLVRQASNDGTERTWRYDEHGWLASTTNGADQVNYTRDAHGNSVAAINKRDKVGVPHI